jgi:hypothetical protein
MSVRYVRFGRDVELAFGMEPVVQVHAMFAAACKEPIVGTLRNLGDRNDRWRRTISSRTPACGPA